MLTKVCTKCDVEKTIDCFSKAKFGKNGTSATCKACYATYRSVNKQSIAEKKKIYYLNNKESLSSQKKIAYVLNKEKITSRNKKWRDNNKKAISAYNQLHKQELARKRKEYKKNNKAKYFAHEARRRAGTANATPSWVDKDAIVGMYQLASAFNRTGINLHVDHIVPLNSDKVCGLHCEANLQLLPASDNISKGNRWWPDMW
jgi:post-segregation antitoxin (ccd killing protein)